MWSWFQMPTSHYLTASQLIGRLLSTAMWDQSSSFYHCAAVCKVVVIMSLCQEPHRIPTIEQCLTWRSRFWSFAIQSPWPRFGRFPLCSQQHEFIPWDQPTGTAFRSRLLVAHARVLYHTQTVFPRPEPLELSEHHAKETLVIEICIQFACMREFGY